MNVSLKNNYILIGILLFSFISRIYRLEYPPLEYFDEVYHVFTAQKIADNDPKAWEWWHEAPKGFAYEWTHPPFAKLIMAGCIKLFGQHSFVWRLPGALLGVAIIYLTYLIATMLFTQTIGLIAAAVLSLDGLLLTLSRIGMNDMYMLSCALLALYAFLNKNVLLSTVCFGLAISSKWSAIWFVPIFGLIHLVLQKKFNVSYILFIVLSPFIYILSYFLLFLMGHSWQHFLKLQQQMWWYHTGLSATHSYSSFAWQWPLLVRPIYLFTTQDAQWPARIYMMGNPIFFWFGLCCVFVALYYLIIQKNKMLSIILIGYFVLWLPWVFSPRLLFLYHYVPGLPFLSMIIAYCLEKNKIFLYMYFIFAILAFFYFYPHWTGLAVPEWLDISYYWFSTWR